LPGLPGQEAIIADAPHVAWQNVQQEPVDELQRVHARDLPPPLIAIVLVRENTTSAMDVTSGIFISSGTTRGHHQCAFAV
jgi:hypothetical protein